MKKSIVSLALVILMLINTASIVNAATMNSKTYQDVKNSNWAYEAISTMSSNAIINGYPDGTFRPQNTLTYGEFIKMSLIAGTKNNVGNAEKPNHWAQKYYDSGVESKYFTEEAIPKYKLDRPITRSDMALIISAILGDIKIENYDKIQGGIKDVTAKTENEYDIIKSYASGILAGYEDNTFKPEQTLTRAESAMVIHRLVDESKRVLPGEKKEETPTPTNRDYSNVESISKSSNSTLPVTDIASNIYSFTLGNLPNQPAVFKDIKYYEVIKDYPFEIKNGKGKDGRQTIDIDKKSGLGCAMLIKDNKIISRLVSTVIDNSNYVSFYITGGANLPKDYDYIAFYSTSVSFDTLIVVPNPFK